MSSIYVYLIFTDSLSGRFHQITLHGASSSPQLEILKCITCPSRRVFASMVSNEIKRNNNCAISIYIRILQTDDQRERDKDDREQSR